MSISLISLITTPIKQIATIATFVTHNVVAAAVTGVIIVGGSAAGVISVVNHSNGKSGTAQTHTQTQTLKPTGIKKTDPDAPTILVKDPDTGKTRAVSQKDIKENPSLLNDVVKNPTVSDYQTAGIAPPTNTAIYNCVKAVTNGQTYYTAAPIGVVVDLTRYCKTISDPSSNSTISQSEVKYSHTTQTYINGNTSIESSMFDTLTDGKGGKLCTGAGTRSGFNASTTYYIGGSTTPTIPSRQYDMNCKRSEYVSNGNGAYTAPDGSTAFGFYTFYAQYQYQPTTFTYQTRIISCTIHTHQTNLLNNSTGKYYDRDYDTPYAFTDTYPTSSVGYAGQEPCSFLRDNGTMTRISIYAKYDANNSWTIGESFFGISALHND
ncbi:hypothetical protein H7Y63_00055 [Polaromonas sp.]|nr:hypothetical protein [Candidatus Saccharibacteria bacterium]